MKRGVTGLRGYPSQFWLTFAAMLLYLASSSFVFPSLGLSMRDTLGAMIFVPISSSMVASLAPETSSGRYVSVSRRPPTATARTLRVRAAAASRSVTAAGGPVAAPAFAPPDGLPGRTSAGAAADVSAGSLAR